jgi:hypothetical protein
MISLTDLLNEPVKAKTSTRAAKVTATELPLIESTSPQQLLNAAGLVPQQALAIWSAINGGATINLEGATITPLGGNRLYVEVTIDSPVNVSPVLDQEPTADAERFAFPIEGRRESVLHNGTRFSVPSAVLLAISALIASAHLHSLRKVVIALDKGRVADYEGNVMIVKNTSAPSDVLIAVALACRPASDALTASFARALMNAIGIDTPSEYPAIEVNVNPMRADVTETNDDDVEHVTAEEITAEEITAEDLVTEVAPAPKKKRASRKKKA